MKKTILLIRNKLVPRSMNNGKYGIRKVILAIILITGLILMLSGCTEEYTRKDVRNFIIAKYGFDNFSVSEEPEEVEDEDGYNDLLWTITIDSEEKIVFHVLDSYSWQFESISNSLWTDYEDVMLRHCYEKYDGLMNFTLDTRIDDGMEVNSISAKYTDRKSLNDRLNELSKFSDFVIAQGFTEEMCMRYNLLFDNPIRNNVMNDEDDYAVDDGDYSASVTSFDDEDRILAEETYLYSCIDYRFEENLLEFTEEEIKAVVKKQNDQVGISYGGEDDYTYYEDLLASQYRYGISFGTLFEILTREGLEVEGNSWRYLYIDEEGNKYEFSYDFVKENPEDSEGNIWYYYLKNGKTVWMDYYFYNHLYVTEAEEITGLNLSIYRDDV